MNVFHMLGIRYLILCILLFYAYYLFLLKSKLCCWQSESFHVATKLHLCCFFSAWRWDTDFLQWDYKCLIRTDGRWSLFLYRQMIGIFFLASIMYKRLNICYKSFLIKSLSLMHLSEDSLVRLTIHSSLSSSSSSSSSWLILFLIVGFLFLAALSHRFCRSVHTAA